MLKTTSALNSLEETRYELKATNEIKIQPLETANYHNILRLLKDKSTKYYTFRPKDQRGFKVIPRNVHHATDKDDIINELAQQGHEVINLHNIQRYDSKQPLPLFSIELKMKDNNIDNYQIEQLLHCKVIFKPPRPKRTLSQCTNCQKYEHTKNYCTKDPTCVKCAGKHSSCTINTRSDRTTIKCALCSENHTANCKGCVVYKALQIQKYPTLRNKEVPVIETTHQTKQHSTKNNVVSLKTPALSYAEVLNKSQVTSHQTNSTTQPTIVPDIQPASTELSQTAHNDFDELKQMMKQLIAQMTNMMNIFTLLLSKLDK